MPLKILFLVLSSIIATSGFGVESVVFQHTFGKEVEFRVDKKEGKPFWFMSFLEVKLPDDIQDQFEHENLGGYSYGIDWSPREEVVPLEEALRQHKLYSIWDSVKCKKGKLDVVSKDDGTLILRVHSLAECETIWDD